MNENFIKACRDGDINKFNELVSRADVNYVSESGGSRVCCGLILYYHQGHSKLQAIGHLYLSCISCDLNRSSETIKM